ncbi:MAG: hypothetical protein LAT53_09565 [Idiomarina sp.]|nr:hypothetical protein [Idiomarina sp.]
MSLQNSARGLFIIQLISEKGSQSLGTHTETRSVTRELQIDSLEATEGALREGLIFALLEQRLQKPFTGMFKS